ncbi:MAG: tetratricopeptide repeat protein [Ignavibacteria bacterium]
MLKSLLFVGITVFLLNSKTFPQSDLDSGYYFLNKGNTAKASQIFENHIKDNPKNNKIRLQLGYIYYNQRKFDKSLRHFEYVGKHASDPADLETSKSAVFVIREELTYVAPRSFDMYFHNYYDSYQENYIANFIGHYNFRIAKNFYTGLYVDLYTDSRSKPGLIYNDRFVELGGFLKYNIMKNLFLEFRVGYTRQVNTDTSQINIKPLLVYFNRFGEAKIYVSRKSATKTSLYLDLYYAAMYDLKYKNTFLQAVLQEVLRFHTGGYSYFESYLIQNGQFDSRRLDYNNFLEVGSGLRYHPNLIYFPILFVEPTYKVYVQGSRKNSFQVKVGFQFIFKTKL